MLLVGVLDKVGTFGFLRYCLGLFPHASHWFTPVVLTLAVVGVIYGALQAIGQKDMLRLIAYTSVSHFGLITLASSRSRVRVRPARRCTWSTTASRPARCCS